MQPVKYIIILAVLVSSCRSVRQTATLPAVYNQVPMAYAVSPKETLRDVATDKLKSDESGVQGIDEINETPETTTKALAVSSKSTTKKIQSFTQMKEMAANGELKMSKMDRKVLNKLEKKYDGNFDKFRADTFEFTTKAKIIAGVGILGLLLAIFIGSWFGAFLFILAALGFILRFLGVIEF